MKIHLLFLFETTKHVQTKFLVSKLPPVKSVEKDLIRRPTIGTKKNQCRSSLLEGCLASRLARYQSHSTALRYILHLSCSMGFLAMILTCPSDVDKTSCRDKTCPQMLITHRISCLGVNNIWSLKLSWCLSRRAWGPTMRTEYISLSPPLFPRLSNSYVWVFYVMFVWLFMYVLTFNNCHDNKFNFRCSRSLDRYPSNDVFGGCSRGIRNLKMSSSAVKVDGPWSLRISHAFCNHITNIYRIHLLYSLKEPLDNLNDLFFGMGCFSPHLGNHLSIHPQETSDAGPAGEVLVCLGTATAGWKSIVPNS